MWKGVVTKMLLHDVGCWERVGRDEAEDPWGRSIKE